MDRGALWVYGGAKSQTELSDTHTHTLYLVGFLNGLGLGSLVGRARVSSVSREHVQRWIWALWSLGSLSTDWWGCALPS